jgi:hypothetical protein
MANEHDHITVQQISSATEYDEETVRKRLKWGIRKMQLSGTLEGDKFVRRHRMRALHIGYTNWIEEQHNSPEAIENLAILGTANEHEYISVQQISTETGLDTITVRARLQWGIENQRLVGTFVDDMFIRSQMVKELHNEYIKWLENQR